MAKISLHAKIFWLYNVLYYLCPFFPLLTCAGSVVDVLSINMENKARNYESPSLAAIFLVNNFHFVHKTFTNNSLMLRLLEGVYAEIQTHFEGVIQEKIHAYQRS